MTSEIAHPSDPDNQLELQLPAPLATAETLVPARMVNEWVYCPRLAWLEWVDGQWPESGDTAQGRRVHRRVDAGSPRALPPPDEADTGTEDAAPDFTARAVTLSAERLGLIAKLDMIEGTDGAVTVIDYKKGKRPHVAAGAYDPERVQLCAQALILEENGYRVEGAAIWYAASRERVRIALDEALRAATLKAARELRLSIAASRPPPPLEDSPKCPRCALAGICLPDEVNHFRSGHPPRPLNPGDDPALPVYVQTPGARVRKTGDCLAVESDEGKAEVPLGEISELALFGPVSLTTPALHELMRREIPVAYHSTGGWFLGHAQGLGAGSVMARTAQYRASFDSTACLALAQGLVAAKIRNQRTLLRRNWKQVADEAAKGETLERLRQLARKAATARALDQLLGLEGEAAALYFAQLPAMLRGDPEVTGFDFQKRNRRPPADPVNALLGFGYAVLTRTFTVALAGVGLDPQRGFYHQLRPGRPALALDLMEPFRPLIADSCVLQVINNGEVSASDFVHAGPACALGPKGRRAFLAAYERRLEQETTHPVFGYRVSMRRLIELQCRLLTRYLMGELDAYPHYEPR